MRHNRPLQLRLPKEASKAHNRLVLQRIKHKK